MADESNSNARNQAKREKLTGFANWSVWSGITESMPVEKDVWDLVSTGLRPKRQNPTLWAKEIKEDRMAVGIAQQIIREGVSDQIAFNIMDLKDPKEMWDKLKSICIEVDQGAVYSIFQELLHCNADICRSTIPLQTPPNGNDPRSRLLGHNSNRNRLRLITRRLRNDHRQLVGDR